MSTRRWRGRVGCEPPDDHTGGVDCQSTDLLELDHNPPFERTGRTLTHELEPRCAPCHRARHRHDPMASRARAA
jgi:hypothetical protein